MRSGEKKRCERESGFPEQLVNDLPVEIVPIEDAYLAAERPDILNDVPGAGLTELEFVFGHLSGLDHPDEGVHRERVVLR